MSIQPSLFMSKREVFHLLSKRFPTLVISGFLLCVTSFSSNAGLVLSNFAKSDVCEKDFCLGISDNYWVAQQFTTDNNSYTLNSIDALINPRNQASALAMILAIYDDTTGKPGEQLGSRLTQENIIDITGKFDREHWLSNGSVILQALTDYWFVIGYEPNINSGNPQFQMTTSTDLDAASRFTISSLQSSKYFDEAQIWNTFEGISVVKFEIDATVVPEPASLAIFALGLIGLASRQFKKKS